MHSTLFLRKSTQKQRPKVEIRVVDTLDNVMDVTTDDLNRIFGKHVDSEDDFEVDPPQMAVDNAPDEYDLMEDELKDFIMEQRNKNTTKKTDLCVKKFKEWLVLTHNVKHTNLEKFQPKLLNLYIGGFILSLKKKDGTSFEPDTLTSYHRAIHR